MRNFGLRKIGFLLAFMGGGVCSQAQVQQAQDASGRRARDLDDPLPGPVLIANYYCYDGEPGGYIHREMMTSPLGWFHDTTWRGFGFVSLGDMLSKVAGLTPIEEDQWEKRFNFELGSFSEYDWRMYRLHSPPDGYDHAGPEDPFYRISDTNGSHFSYSSIYGSGEFPWMTQCGHFCQIWSPVVAENDIKRTFIKLSYEMDGYDNPSPYVIGGDFGSALESHGFSLKSAESVELTIPVGARHSDTYRLQPEPALGKTRVDALVPVNIAVDANRDGAITFEDKDKTSAEKPYRFWINNDQDDVDADEPVIVDENKRDLLDSVIKTSRDLEDFSRIKISVGIAPDDLAGGKFEIGIKFKNASTAGPAIRVWPNESSVGAQEYLTNQEAAVRQRSKACIGDTLNSDGVVFIPKSYWADRAGRDIAEADLIFEGVKEGAGELILVLKQAGSSLDVKSESVCLNLLDVREMYQRARVKNEAEQIPEPWVNDDPPAQTWEWDPNWPYSEDPQAEAIACIFVHGWRMPYVESRSWADTSYKRLWHQGYKGKFYAFRWATFSGDDTPFLGGRTTYNPSEYRAWLCGPALADFVNGLPESPRQRRLFAHSMGNVISGAALRAGMQIEKYSLCNAAMSASAYDTNPMLRKDLDGHDLSLIGNLDTPDTDPDLTYRAAFGLQDKFHRTSFPQMFNFGLPDDFALGVWSSNNFYFKPEYRSLGYWYLFPPHKRPTQNGRLVISLPEVMGYVTKSLTRTAGADLRTKGIITDFQDMRDWSNMGADHDGFGSEHSAEWVWKYQSTNLFWKRLVDTLQLKPQNN